VRSALAGLAFGALVAIAIASSACHMPRVFGAPRLSGTCEGACDHYLECRGGGVTKDARTSCVADCRDVFADQESLRAFESLSCRDAVEYVEGTHAERASR
jgi:hypothetical protein